MIQNAVCKSNLYTAVNHSARLMFHLLTDDKHGSRIDWLLDDECLTTASIFFHSHS